MIVPIVAGIGALVVALVVVSRGISRRRDAARQDLERELAEVGHHDIMDLVREEAAEIGLERIPGADDVDLVTRLRVWHRDEAIRTACPDPSRLRFVRDADDPTEAQLHLEVVKEDSPSDAAPPTA